MIFDVSLFVPYLGFANVLSQKDLDQGDSSQRSGHFYALAGLLKLPKDYLQRDLKRGWGYTAKLHEASPGLYRRSPDPTYWGSRPNNFSRDQHSILRIAMAVMGDKKRLKQSLYGMIKRLGFHQNYHIGTDTTDIWWKDYKIPDIITPSEITTFIRGFDAWYLYPLLTILDLFLFVDLYLRKDDNWDSDNMMALNLLYANCKYPTVASRIVLHKYKKTNFMDRIYNYYDCSPGRNGLEPLAHLYKLAYDKLT